MSKPFNKKLKKQGFQARAFLNSIESDHSGSIKSDIEVTRNVSKAKANPGPYWRVWGSMEIRDCARRIDLSFDGDTRHQKKKLINSISKCDEIIRVCNYQKAVLEAVLEASNDSQ